MPSGPGYINGPLVIPQTAEVKLHWILPNGKRASNVLHAIVPDEFTWQEDEATAVLEAIAASGGWAELHPFLSTTTELESIEIKDIRGANLAGYLSTEGGIIGTSAADALPLNVALSVPLLTAQTGRSFRGRVYLAGFTEDATVSTGRADPAVQGAANGFVADVRAALTANGFELAIGHRGHAEYVSPNTGRTIPAEAAGSVPVTRIGTPDAIFDSQRRRK